jgi:outer membrane biosynthesis protein TonB
VINGLRMDSFEGIGEKARVGERVLVRNMMVLSLAVHIAVFIIGTAVSPLFGTVRVPPAVIVELADLSMPELPTETAAPVPKIARVLHERPAHRSPLALAPQRNVGKDARRWLEKLDAGMPQVPDTPALQKRGIAGDVPVQHWTNDGPARPGDFAPAVPTARTAALDRHLQELEARVRGSGRAAVGFGNETKASMMFGSTGAASGEPIPAWIRDMIRKRVREYLPELEAVYNDAIRRNPDLRGRLLVRFRIDRSGKIQRAEPAEEHFGDAAFIDAVLGKVRGWSFEPTGGRSVDVIYPIVFVAPS